MAFLSGLGRRRDYVIEALEPHHSGALSELHAEDFTRPWNPAEFEALLNDGVVFGYLGRQVGYPDAEPAGFVLARLVAGEGEILTIATARAHRRQGLGWKLMNAVLGRLHEERAEALFLEVDETNAPAVTLYRGLGFAQVGVRANYYEGSGPHGRTNALVMRRDLR